MKVHHRWRAKILGQRLNQQQTAERAAPELFRMLRYLAAQHRSLADGGPAAFEIGLEAAATSKIAPFTTNNLEARICADEPLLK